MAWFDDERASNDAAANWDRIAELVSSGKTVEVYRHKESGEYFLYLRVWTGKRADGSNKVHADSDLDY